MSKVCPDNNQVRRPSPSKDHMSNEQDTPLKSLKSGQNSFLTKEEIIGAMVAPHSHLMNIIHVITLKTHRSMKML